MRKLIDGKLYDTEKATGITYILSAEAFGDTNYFFEELYIRQDGSYFLHGSGGAYTKYGVHGKGYSRGSSDIFAFSRKEAYEWLKDHGKTEVILEHFSDFIEEA